MGQFNSMLTIFASALIGSAVFMSMVIMIARTFRTMLSRLIDQIGSI